MKYLPSIPEELETVLGPVATRKLVDFLYRTFSMHKEDVISVSAERFENRLVSEIGAIRLEMAEFREDIKTEMAEFKSEMYSEIAGVKAEIATVKSELKSDFAAVHREISLQTKWILAGLMLAVTIYPIVSRLMVRLIP